MKITEVNIKPITGKGKLVAFVDIIIDNALKVTGLKIVNGSNGLFISMPSTSYEKDGQKEYKDIVYPINKETRKDIIDSILKAYKDKKPEDSKTTDGLFD